MKLLILVLPLINIFINVFKYVWIPIVYPIRNVSREVVYNYWLNNGIAYHLPNNITLEQTLINHKIVKVYTNSVNFTIVATVVSKLKYYMYTYLVWIWFDDTLSADIVGYRLASDITSSKYLTKKYDKELNNLCRLGNGSSFDNYNITKNNHYKISLGLLYLSILYNDNNNFKNYFYYNKNKLTIFNIGFKQQVLINYTRMYMYSI